MIYKYKQATHNTFSNSANKTRALQSTHTARCICINLRAAGAALIYNIMHVFVHNVYLRMLGQLCA